MMTRRALAGVLATIVVLAAVAGCKGEEPLSIIVASDRITVINRTDRRWSHVDVWLNDHYRVQAPELLPGQRLDVPISVFVAGFGQLFDPKKQVPFGVEVDAKGADGQPVTLTWGKGRRR